MQNLKTPWARIGRRQRCVFGNCDVGSHRHGLLCARRSITVGERDHVTMGVSARTEAVSECAATDSSTQSDRVESIAEWWASGVHEDNGLAMSLCSHQQSRSTSVCAIVGKNWYRQSKVDFRQSDVSVLRERCTQGRCRRCHFSSKFSKFSYTQFL